jgi:hypothetical protein
MILKATGRVVPRYLGRINDPQFGIMYGMAASKAKPTSLKIK